MVATFNMPEPVEPEQFDEPLYDVQDLIGIIPSKDQHTMDPYQVGHKHNKLNMLHSSCKQVALTIDKHCLYLPKCIFSIVDVRVAYIRKLAILRNREPVVIVNYSPSFGALNLNS